MTKGAGTGELNLAGVQDNIGFLAQYHLWKRVCTPVLEEFESKLVQGPRMASGLRTSEAMIEASKKPCAGI